MSKIKLGHAVPGPAPRDPSLDWQSGEPPKPDWYLASIDYYTDQWRWWNGSNWSYPAHPTHNKVEANAIAQVRSGFANKEMKWIPR